MNIDIYVCVRACVYVQKHLQQTQNFYIPVKDTQSMKCLNILKRNMLHICSNRAFMCDCNVCNKL